MDLNNEKNPQKGYNLHEINTVYNNIIVIKNNRKKFSGKYIVKCISLSGDCHR